jgi:hypothetical protein
MKAGHGSECKHVGATESDTDEGSEEPSMPDNRNVLYIIVGALIVATVVLGYNLYQEKKEPEGLQINVGRDGLKIQNK